MKAAPVLLCPLCYMPYTREYRPFREPSSTELPTATKKPYCPNHFSGAWAHSSSLKFKTLSFGLIFFHCLHQPQSQGVVSTIRFFFSAKRGAAITGTGEPAAAAIHLVVTLLRSLGVCTFVHWK